MPDVDAESQVYTVASLYQEFQEALLRYARRLTLGDDRSGDLVQSTFVRAMAHFDLLQRLNRYQRRAWLYQTLKHLFLDQLRARQREREMLEQMLRAALLESSSPVGQALPSSLLEAAPEKYQDLLYQRFVLDMTSAEIGALHGVPAATIRSRLHLAIQWLRTHKDDIL